MLLAVLPTGYVIRFFRTERSAGNSARFQLDDSVVMHAIGPSFHPNQSIWEYAIFLRCSAVQERCSLRQRAC